MWHTYRWVATGAGLSRLSQAVRAASRGWHVFPCNPPGTVDPETGVNIEKMPHLIRPDKPYKLRWGEAATTDLRRIVDWWTYSPGANIGIACRPSGLLVLDCDTAKRENQLADTPWSYLHDELGPWVDGADCLRGMCRRFGDDYSRLERTYRVCTASLGMHVVLSWPQEVRATQSSPVPGLLDIRGNAGRWGGYVLGAGSVTSKGEYFIENDAPVLPATDFPWIVEHCREKPKPKPVKPTFSQPGHATYGGLVDAVRLAQEGNRNNVTLWAARSMCEDGATEEKCVELLLPAGVEAGQSERDVLATIRSAFRLQGSKS